MKSDLDEEAHSIGAAAKRITRRVIVDLARFHRNYDNPATMDLLEIARDALRFAISKDRDPSALAEGRRRITEMESKLNTYGVE